MANGSATRAIELVWPWVSWMAWAIDLIPLPADWDEYRPAILMWILIGIMMYSWTILLKIVIWIIRIIIYFLKISFSNEPSV